MKYITYGQEQDKHNLQPPEPAWGCYTIKHISHSLSCCYQK